MACPTGQLGSGNSSNGSSQQSPSGPPIRERKHGRNGPATRERTSLDRWFWFLGSPARDVDNQRQPKQSSPLYRAHDLPADDRHKCYQLLCSFDLCRLGYQLNHQLAFRYWSLRHCQNDHLCSIPFACGRLPGQEKITTVDLNCTRPRNVRYWLLYPFRSSGCTRRRTTYSSHSSRRLLRFDLHFPLRCIFPVRMGSLLLDYCV